MIKLIATDLDGTLVPVGSRHLPEEYVDIIRKLTDKGVKFVVATGRQEDSVLETFAPVLDRVTLITSDGANISNAGGMLHSFAIPNDIVFKIMNDLEVETQCDTMAATPDCLYALDSLSEMARYVATQEYGFGLKIIKSVDELPDINKICIYSQKNTRPVIAGEPLGEDGFPLHPIIKYADKYEGVQAFVAGDEWVDFVAAGVSKGNALKMVQKIFGISKEETISFGDQDNDISMFEESCTSYAVEDASSVALAAADKKIPNCHKLGELEILKEIYNSIL